MNGSAITSRVQIASGLATDGAETMHPSLIEKPFLTVADLHLMAKLMETGDEDISYHFTAAELKAWDSITVRLDAYLTQAVGEDWANMEALVS